MEQEVCKFNTGMQQLQAGEILQGGVYKVEKVLGQGGFGITYLAKEVQSDRQVAIKEFFMSEYCERCGSTIVTPTVSGSTVVEQYRKKFIKEAMKLKSLEHPNIVKVLDIFEENCTVYYVMNYQKGGSLQDYINKNGKMNEYNAISCIKNIASALNYLHRRLHMCHYDVKPGNIMLDTQGNALLIDFGLAKGYDNNGIQTSTTPIGLSVNFAPIEQYRQNVEEFSPESDIYSLGATAYYLLTGNLPPSAIERVSGRQIDYSCLKNHLRNAIEKALALSKEDRWHTLYPFIHSLEQEEKTISPDVHKFIDRVDHDDYVNWNVYIIVSILGYVIEGYMIFNGYFEFLPKGILMMLIVVILFFLPVLLGLLFGKLLYSRT